MGKNHPIQASFSDFVKQVMYAKGMTQAYLSEASLLSKTTISRIYRNSNDKGSTYQPTLEVVLAVGVGLQLNCEESEELLYSAFPVMELWWHFLEKQLCIDGANDILYEQGLPLLGRNEE